MRGKILLLAGLLAGCSASAENVQTLTLPTSGLKIDVVQQRSDVKFTDCGTLVVLQTYDTTGKLIDSKEARGRALHCEVIDAGIQSGGMVGAAAVLRPSRTTNNNSNEGVSNDTAVNSSSSSSARSTSRASARATGGTGGQSTVTYSGPSNPSGGSSDGPTGQHGNNGFGNGGGDGSPNGKNDSNR